MKTCVFLAVSAMLLLTATAEEEPFTATPDSLDHIFVKPLGDPCKNDEECPKDKGLRCDKQLIQYMDDEPEAYGTCYLKELYEMQNL